MQLLQPSIMLLILWLICNDVHIVTLTLGLFDMFLLSSLQLMNFKKIIYLSNDKGFVVNVLFLYQNFDQWVNFITILITHAIFH